MADKPKAGTSLAAKELDEVEKQFDKFDKEIKDMTLDRMSGAKKEDVEPQTKMAKSDIDKSNDIYLKPSKSISSKEPFNEKYREEYNFAKEYVKFIAEHREIINETIEMWTKPFAGLPAEFWNVPTNKPVWGPRYVAEQIKNCKYHRFVMKDMNNGMDQHGKYYGTMAADTIINRLDAFPVSTKKSVFMGSTNF